MPPMLPSALSPSSDMRSCAKANASASGHQCKHKHGRKRKCNLSKPDARREYAARHDADHARNCPIRTRRARSRRLGFRHPAAGAAWAMRVRARRSRFPVHSGKHQACAHHNRAGDGIRAEVEVRLEWLGGAIGLREVLHMRLCAHWCCSGYELSNTCSVRIRLERRGSPGKRNPAHRLRLNERRTPACSFRKRSG